jgi:hypothetical protein
MLGPKFGAKIRRRRLKTENDQKKRQADFSGVTDGLFPSYNLQRNTQKNEKNTPGNHAWHWPCFPASKSNDSSSDDHISASQYLLQ